MSLRTSQSICGAIGVAGGGLRTGVGGCSSGAGVGVGNRRIGFNTSGVGVRTGGGVSIAASSRRTGIPRSGARRRGQAARGFGARARAQRPLGRVLERARQLHHPAEAPIRSLGERAIENGLERHRLERWDPTK